MNADASKIAYDALPMSSCGAHCGNNGRRIGQSLKPRRRDSPAIPKAFEPAQTLPWYGDRMMVFGNLNEA